MSFQAEPKQFDLAEEEVLWARPGEEFVIYADFNEDISAATFEVVIEEKKWPYMSTTYNPVGTTSITSGFVVEDNDDDPIITNSRVRLVIDEPTITSWTDKHLDLRLIVTFGGNTWVAANRTLTVAIGE